MPGPRRGMLSLEELRVAVGAGEIDTVVLAFTDMQGRLAGKRLSAEFFLEEVAEHYSEGCNYLLACCHDLHLMMFACMFLGQSKPALRANTTYLRLTGPQ